MGQCTHKQGLAEHSKWEAFPKRNINSKFCNATNSCFRSYCPLHLLTHVCRITIPPSPPQKSKKQKTKQQNKINTTRDVQLFLPFLVQQAHSLPAGDLHRFHRVPTVGNMGRTCLPWCTGHPGEHQQDSGVLELTAPKFSSALLIIRGLWRHTHWKFQPPQYTVPQCSQSRGA